MFIGFFHLRLLLAAVPRNWMAHTSAPNGTSAAPAADGAAEPALTKKTALETLREVMEEMQHPLEEETWLFIEGRQDWYGSKKEKP